MECSAVVSLRPVGRQIRRPELVEGRAVGCSWFDRLTTSVGTDIGAQQTRPLRTIALPGIHGRTRVSSLPRALSPVCGEGSTIGFRVDSAARLNRRMERAMMLKYASFFVSAAILACVVELAAQQPEGKPAASRPSAECSALKGRTFDHTTSIVDSALVTSGTL